MVAGMAKSRLAAGREWAFLGLLLALCAVLAVLQFRWTGELAEAEIARLGGKEKELAEDFCARFDRELGVSCAELVPESGTLDAAGITARIQRWRGGGPRPVFGRIALAMPGAGGATLTGFSPVDGRQVAMTWPEEWAGLRSNLELKAKGGSPPYTDRTGMLIEFPIHSSRGEGGPPAGERGPRGPRPPDRGRRQDPDDGGDGPGGPPPPESGGGAGGGPGGRGGAEAGWVILELDSDYLHRTWLPELIGQTLNPPGLEIHHARVLQDGAVLFESGPALGASGAVQKFPFNLQGRGAGAGRDSAPHSAQWVLETARVPGLLERTVAASRLRNLALAIGVMGLILAAGVLLVRQTRRARMLAQAQMDFVANVSHELRTPLTVIRGAAHNLKRGIVKDAAGVERYAGMILQHTDQLNEMVQQVLDFSSSTGKLMLSHQPVALEPLLREALANTTGECTACVVEVEIAANLPLIQGDGAALRRAFQNLLVNAAKHGGSGRWIGLTAGAGEDGSVEVRVADRGPGIPKGEQAEIFNAFYRGAAARAGQVRGSGLGLGLVREIVTGHGGSISVCSGEGSGATFVVRLPLVEASGNESAAATGGG